MRKVFIIVFLTMLIALYVAALAPPANAYIKPKPIPGVTVITDGMATRLSFVVAKDRKSITCVQVRTAPGKRRDIRLYSAGKLVESFSVAANHDTKKCEATNVPLHHRNLHVKVQERIILSKWLGKGSANVKLY